MERQRGRGAESQPRAICVGKRGQGSHHGPNMQDVPGTKAVPPPTAAHPLCLSRHNSSREFDRSDICLGSLHLRGVQRLVEAVFGVSADHPLFPRPASHHQRTDCHRNSLDRLRELSHAG